MTAADKLAQVLAEHVSEDHYAGNGYNEPREAWVVCSCGADIWEWQQFYNENPADPEDAFRAHVAAVVLAHLTAEGWAQGPRWRWEIESVPQMFGNCGLPKLMRRRVTDWEAVDA